MGKKDVVCILKETRRFVKVISVVGVPEMKPTSPIKSDPNINLSETFSGSNLGEDEASDTCDGCD